MINHISQNENTKDDFSKAIKELQIGKLLRNSNISKNCGISAFEVFQFLLLLVFQGKNLFRFLNSKHKDQAVSKNTLTITIQCLLFQFTIVIQHIPKYFSVIHISLATLILIIQFLQQTFNTPSISLC